VKRGHSSALTWPATALGVRLQPVIMIRSYIAALLAPYKLHRDHLPAVFRLTRQTRVRATGLAPRLILSKHLTPMKKWSKGVDFIRLGEHCRCIGDRIEPTIPSFLYPHLIPASRESVTSPVISSYHHAPKALYYYSSSLSKSRLQQSRSSLSASSMVFSQPPITIEHHMPTSYSVTDGSHHLRFSSASPTDAEVMLQSPPPHHHHHHHTKRKRADAN
jgi:hypothetical protein